MGNNKIVKCRACGLNGHKDSSNFDRMFKKVDSKSGGSFHICRNCETGYNSCNEQVLIKEIVGTPKIHGWCYGYEFESTTLQDTLFLFDSNFKRASDGSVHGEAVEWKSPIYQGLNGIPKVLSSIEESVDLKVTVNRSCGTHIHISNNAKDKALDWGLFVLSFRNGYYGENLRKSVLQFDKYFGKLERHMSSKQYQTRKIWGRFFTKYASREYDGCNRYVWLNPSTAHNTLEFRISKMKSKEQFFALFQIITDIVNVAFEDFRNPSDLDIGQLVLDTYLKGIENYR